MPLRDQVDANAAALRTKATDVRDACFTAGNVLEGTRGSCGAAADEMEDLADRLEGASDAEAPPLLATAARVLGRFGDPRQLSSGSELADLADGIIKDAKKATAIGGGAVVAGFLAFVVYKVLTRGS